MSEIENLVHRVYPALGTGDTVALAELLDPEFQGQLAMGLPLGIGGIRYGADEMIENGWWAIGRAYDLRAVPEEWIPCADGRLLVRGRYTGAARWTGKQVDAEFMHLWSAAGGRLVGLVQLTDTHSWHEALDG